MTDLVDRAFRLWREPVPVDDASALAAFGSVYSDPIVVNGEEGPLQEVVERARMLQGAFDELGWEVFEQVEAPGHHAFAFVISGRHTGVLQTPLGPLPATGKRLEMRGMDIFIVEDDRVAAVWAVSDLLSLLAQAAAVKLVASTS